MLVVYLRICLLKNNFQEQRYYNNHNGLILEKGCVLVRFGFQGSTIVTTFIAVNKNV